MAKRRPLKGFEGFYEVDSEGSIYSLDRPIVYSDGKRSSIKGRKIKLWPNRDGYLVARLGVNGKKFTIQVSRAVWKSFHGNIPEGMVVNHLNLIRSDNRVENLEVTSQSENVRYFYRMNKSIVSRRGENHPLTSLTEKDVLEMFKIYGEGKTQREIAEKYGVTRSAVWSILNGVNWTHVFKQIKFGI